MGKGDEGGGTSESPLYDKVKPFQIKRKEKNNGLSFDSNVCQKKINPYFQSVRNVDHFDHPNRVGFQLSVSYSIRHPVPK